MFKHLWNLGKAEPLYPRMPNESKNQWLNRAYDSLEREYGIMAGEEMVALVEGYTVTNAIVRAVLVTIAVTIIVVGYEVLRCM